MNRPLPKLNYISTSVLRIVFCVAVFFNATSSFSQCIAGSTTANVNWDNLDYLVTTGNYSGYVSNAMSRTQAFAIGVNRVEIVYPNTITTSGENVAHTGDAGSFGTGADVQYTGNGTITFTFDNEVNNFQFSLFDLDNGQRVNVTAANAAATPLNITMTKPGASGVTITNSGTTNAQGQGAGGGAATNSNAATVNITITGPVKTVSIILSATAGDFWLSDLTACVTGTFPVNYFVGSRPFTGQPTYVIGTSDTNTVSLINTTTGVAKMIFQDATSPRYINGIGFDHLQYNLYYVIDFTSNPAINKTIKRYNFDTEVMSVVVSDVNTLGIPTFSRGVESAGCAFYDNDLYFGVEGNIGGNSGNRETIIWRIEFDVPGGNAIKACQVYATPSDDGAGNALHDWNDFTIADGLLVDFAGAPTTSARRYTHYDLQTQTIVNNYYTGGPTPRQAGITWNNTRYWVYDRIAVYNMDGTTGPSTAITGATVLDWKGFCGDATGFRPKSDFGDAPASYDPVALSPALHEKDTTLFMGKIFATDWDQEFNKLTSTDATGDGDDDNDGLTFVSVFDPSTNQYLATAQVYNRTGSNARVIAWLDYNGNGVFDASEALTPITVPSSPVVQNVNLFWPSITSSLPSGSYTFLRIRLTSSSNGMTTSNATGYFNNGEVEDYRVLIESSPLSINLLSFGTKVTGNTAVQLLWESTGEANTPGFAVERSTDGFTWKNIGVVETVKNSGKTENDYSFTDSEAIKGKSFYRLKLININGTIKYSEVKLVTLYDVKDLLMMTPNPAKSNATLSVSSNLNGIADLVICDLQGKPVRKEKIKLVAGGNIVQLQNLDKLNNGNYIVQVVMGNTSSKTRIAIAK